MASHTEAPPPASPSPSAPGPIAAAERIALIDVLRGFALFGILVVNMASFKSPGLASQAGATLPDQAATWLISFGFQTKFYVLFSFLFGYGLSVQMARAAARGVALVPRFLRRLLGLLLLGLAHAALLYTGDILVTYALLGMILLLLRNAPDRVLLRAAVGLVAATGLLLAIGGIALALAAPAPESSGSQELETARVIAAFRGTPREVVAQRIGDYPGTLAFALLGQGPTALAMFLTGLWAGRQRLLERLDDNLPLLRRVRALGFAIGATGGVVWATYRLVNGFDFGGGLLLASAVDFATAPFLTAAFVTTLTLLYRAPRWRRRLAPLALVGRMALSNYLLQSLVGAFIFTGYGLGLFGRVGAAVGLALSVAIYAMQLPLSAWWLRRYAFGPTEWLLPSFTYARLQPIRARRTLDGEATSPPSATRAD